jgi:hypothetical protein
MLIIYSLVIAVVPGFEPGLTAPKAAVLPLDDTTIRGLKFQTGFACTIGQSFHPAVVQITVSIEYDSVNIFFQRFLCQQFSDDLRPFHFRLCGRHFTLHILRIRGDRHQCLADSVIDDLSVNIVQTAIDRKSRTLGSSVNFFPDRCLNAQTAFVVMSLYHSVNLPLMIILNWQQSYRLCVGYARFRTSLPCLCTARVP